MEKIIKTREEMLAALDSEMSELFENVDENVYEVLDDLVFSRDNEIAEIEKELTELSGGRLSNYWYYAEKSKTVASKIKRCVKRLLKIGNQILLAEGDITGCDMVPGDGYYPWSIVEIAKKMSCDGSMDADGAIDWLMDIAA